MLEKRRYGRLPLNLPVILRHKGRIIPAMAINMSCGGMYIRAEERDIMGQQKVEVIFDLDQEKRDVSMRGQIIRVEGEEESTGIGIQFTNLFSQSHKIIQHYIKQHLH